MQWFSGAEKLLDASKGCDGMTYCGSGSCSATGMTFTVGGGVAPSWDGAKY